MLAVSYAEAAKLAGVSKNTILRAIKEGRLPVQNLDRGRKAVLLSELEKIYPASKSTPSTEKPPTEDKTQDRIIAELRSTVHTLEARCSDLQNQLLLFQQERRKSLLVLEEMQRRWLQHNV